MYRSLSAQDFDPTNPNYDLLKNLVIEKLNHKRIKKNKTTLEFNEALQKTADAYVAIFSASKLEKTSNNKLYIGKKIKRNCKSNGYSNAFIDYDITSIVCMSSSNLIFYYDKEDNETSTHLFIGKKPSKKEKLDPKYKKKPLKLHSYSHLADLLVKQFITDEGNFKILNNGYDKYGFALAVEQRTLFKNKIPKLKLILIMGGNRITW